MVVYSTQSKFYMLRTDQLEPTPIPGTAGAYQAFFSPDGSWLGFEQAGKERKVRLDGSQPVTITDACCADGATWTSRNQIVLGAEGPFQGLSMVSAAGGNAIALTHPDSAHGELDHSWPIAAPDGRSVFFAIWTGSLATARLAVASIPEGTTTRLGVLGIRPLAVLDGYLVYMQADGAVMAVRLNGAMRQTFGQPFPVHDAVPVIPSLNGNSDVYVSSGGAMVSGRGRGLGRLVWFGPRGRAEEAMPGVRAYQSPRIAPDGRRIAVIVQDSTTRDVWIYYPAEATFSRFTNLGTVTSVDWSADGSRLIYAANGNVWWQPVASGLAGGRLFSGGTTVMAVLSPDGRSLLEVSVSSASFAVFRVPLDSSRIARPFAADTNSSPTPAFSPDGRWVALQSSESGRNEVYVRSVADPSVRLQVSPSGGAQPMWSRDGTRLYYRAGTALIAARVALAPTFRLLGRDTVLSTFAAANYFWASDYDVSADGRRILAVEPRTNDYQLVISPNWITEFRRRVAESGGR